MCIVCLLKFTSSSSGNFFRRTSSVLEKGTGSVVQEKRSETDCSDLLCTSPFLWLSSTVDLPVSNGFFSLEFVVLSSLIACILLIAVL